MMRRAISTFVATLLVAGLASTAAYADAGPTVSITTPSGTVKGKVSLTATAAVDPSGTATLKYAGIKITGLSSYDANMTNASYQGNAHTFGTSGVSDLYWYSLSPSYNFTFDTTDWPTGSYQVTVFTEDSNGRAAASTPITLTTANAGPTVSITTPSGTVKGKVTISASAATDPTGTASLVYAGLKITGLASYSADMPNGSYRGTNHTFGTAGVSDLFWQPSTSSFDFTFDTTSWPTGSYQITVFTEDSNGRAAGSTPITLTIPVAPTLVLNATQISVGANSTFTVKYSGTNSLSDGTLVLQQSTDPQGTWNTVATFTGAAPLFKASALVNLGDYVRAVFSGATNLLDSESAAIQIVVTPKLTCKIATTAKVGTKLRGSCTSNVNLPSVYVELQTSTGSSWTVLGGGNVSGKTIPINVTPKKKGFLYISMTSSGLDGKLGQFASTPIKIKVT